MIQGTSHQTSPSRSFSKMAEGELVAKPKWSHTLTQVYAYTHTYIYIYLFIIWYIIYIHIYIYIQIYNYLSMYVYIYIWYHIRPKSKIFQPRWSCVASWQTIGPGGRNTQKTPRKHPENIQKTPRKHPEKTGSKTTIPYNTLLHSSMATSNPQFLAGWWLGHPSEKHESQLGWLFPIYGKIKNVPNHQPARCFPLQNLQTLRGFPIDPVFGHRFPFRSRSPACHVSSSCRASISSNCCQRSFTRMAACGASWRCPIHRGTPSHPPF